MQKKQHPKEENTVLLQKLLEGIPYKMLQGTDQAEIKMPVYDSRKVQPGDLFVCITGFQTDGHCYIPMALEKGAAALLVEHAVEDVPQNITVIQTENNRQALATLSANFYDHPTQKMRVTGVTGTNGKTTITYLVRSVLERVGRKTGVIGTIENRIGDKVIPTERTTPESLELQALMEQMRQEDVTDVMMEVSSHSLDLHRVDGIAYDVAVFTNLTQDHLDYHKTMENYKIAKSMLFERSKQSVINIDDAAGEAIDKCSKVMGLGYPGGPIIDKLARQGNPKAFTFSKPHIPGLDYSFSGLKTSFLYSLRDWLKEDPDFIEHHKVDLAASLEATVVDILMDKLRKAAKEYKINEIAVAGGVSANNGLRNAFREHAEKYGWNIFIPKFSYTTDNAAMIAITGYFKYLDKDFCSIDLPAYSRVTL